MQKTAVFSLLATFMLLFLAGCPKKPEYPLCNSNDDCREGEWCVDGKCVQCRSDADCPAGQVCGQGVCTEPTETEPIADETNAGSVTSPHAECNLDTIYFDFDSARLKPAAVSALKKTAECLLEKGAEDITIIGHCDPRGTEEYNMGLGLERANAVKKFLVKYGIPEGEITIYSKGEEEAAGYDEESWAKDRKGEFE